MQRKITSISPQAKNQNRVNISVDGNYLFSLDIYQVSDLGVRVGREYSDKELLALQEESVFGKLYTQALEYTMIRPHSAKEIRDYLWRKTLTTKYRSRQTGEVKERQGASKTTTDRVYERLVDKGYVDNEKFARWWIENRNQRKGTSLRKLEMELKSKGVSSDIIHESIQNCPRDEKSEIEKIIQRKKDKYDDVDKLVVYLTRQGFSYDLVRDMVKKTVDD